MSWILSLGAGTDQILLLKAIKNEGHKVAAVDSRPDAEGVEYCDHFKAISNRDVDGITEYARWLGVEAIMVAGSEVAVQAAVVCHRLGLFGIPVVTAMACRDKIQQKRVLQAAGISCTDPHLLHHGAAKATFDELGYKVVVKPRFGSGSRGVTYVDNPMELPVALRDAEEHHHDVLMERYEPGPQLSVESLVWNGECSTPCVVDRWYPPGRPVFKEVAGSWPSSHDTVDVHDLMRLAARALGIERGTLKADMVVTPKGPKIIEITPRLSGGPLASVVRDGSGVDYMRSAVRIALGLEPALPTPTRKKPIARLMNWTDVPFEEREKYLGLARAYP